MNKNSSGLIIRTATGGRIIASIYNIFYLDELWSKLLEIIRYALNDIILITANYLFDFVVENRRYKVPTNKNKVAVLLFAL